MVREALDYEAKESYSVTVQVTDGYGLTNSIDVGVEVEDVDELPPFPTFLWVELPPNKGHNSLTIEWNEPLGITGVPPITAYEIGYRKQGSRDWPTVTSDAPETGRVITGLAANTVYEVKVRALNHEGNSGWTYIAERNTALPQDLRILLERVDGGRICDSCETLRVMPSEVNTREHTQDMVAVHLYNAGETSVVLKNATLTFQDGTGMADATDFSNLSANSFPWFRVPISQERVLEPWEDGVMPTFEAGAYDGDGTWFEEMWRVADDRTLEGDECVQVRFDFELDDGTMGSYTAQPFVLEDNDRAEISVANAAVFEDEEFAEVIVTAKVIDTDDGTMGSGRGPRNSPQQLAVPIHVDYATGDGTATAGSDYDYKETEGTLTIIGDERSRSTTIGVTSDGEREENERFTVTIFNP